MIGNIIIGDDVGIWFRAVLRGDNEPITIGAGSNIQDGVMIHTDMGAPATIGRGCTIGHHAIIHGCTIGDNSLVGMSATVLNGARIGRNCLIGAHALIPERKEIPDNSLVMGAPAKVIRELDADAAAALEMSARHYVANWQRYASGLKKLTD